MAVRPMLALAVVASTMACGVEGASRSPVTSVPSPEASAPDAGDGAPGDGVPFEGDGYAIDLSPTWSESTASLARGIEVWNVGPADQGFQPNVNLLVQDAEDLTLDGYVQLSEDQMEALEGEILEAGTTTGSNGQPMAVFDYEAVQRGVELRFFAVAVEVDGGFALATFTTVAEDSDDLVDAVDPYLRTLRATD